MKRLTVCLAILGSVLLFTVAFADGRKQLSRREMQRYTVTATAGIVNEVEGDVRFKTDQPTWDLLMAGAELSSGNSVKTGSDGRTEILLNPGSYLRLGENTSIVFTNTDLNTLAIELAEGVAIIESSMIEGEKGILMNVSTPQGRLSLLSNGLYRIDVISKEKIEVLVYRGKILTENQTLVKEGKKLFLETGTLTIKSFNKKYQDEFGLWSRQRAEILIALNKSLMGATLTQARLGRSAWCYIGGYYTFLPGRRGYRSAYGYPYYCYYGWYDDRWRYGYPNGSGNSGGSTGTPSGDSSGGGGSSGGGNVPGAGSAPSGGGGHTGPVHTESSGGGGGRPRTHTD